MSTGLTEGRTTEERFRSEQCPVCLTHNSAREAQCVKCGASIEWADRAAFRRFMMGVKHEAVRSLMRGAVEFFLGLLAAVMLGIMVRRALAAGLVWLIVPWALVAMIALGIGGRRCYIAGRRMLFK